MGDMAICACLSGDPDGFGMSVGRQGDGRCFRFDVVTLAILVVAGGASLQDHENKATITAMAKLMMVMTMMISSPWALYRESD